MNRSTRASMRTRNPYQRERLPAAIYEHQSELAEALYCTGDNWIGQVEYPAGAV